MRVFKHFYFYFHTSLHIQIQVVFVNRILQLSGYKKLFEKNPQATKEEFKQLSLNLG